jgi:hypothetical protein
MATRYCPLILLLPLLVCQATQAIPAGYRQVAGQARIPAELLYAVALTESGTRLTHGIHPWPWTLNVAGRSYRYATREDACEALTQFLRTHNPRRIDAGLGQLNLGWNEAHFVTPCDALEPYRNLRITAQLLQQHYQRQQNWLSAAGRYHHPAGGKPALRYRRQVARQLQQINLAMKP